MSQQSNCKIVVDVVLGGPDAFTFKPFVPYEDAPPFEIPQQPSVSNVSTGPSLSDRLREMQQAILRNQLQQSKETIEAAAATRNAQIRQKYAIQNAKKETKASRQGQNQQGGSIKRERDDSQILHLLQQQDSQTSSVAMPSPSISVPPSPAPPGPKRTFLSTTLKRSAPPSEEIPNSFVKLAESTDSPKKVVKTESLISVQTKPDEGSLIQRGSNGFLDKIVRLASMGKVKVVVSTLSSSGSNYSLSKKEKIAGDGLHPARSLETLSHFLFSCEGSHDVVVCSAQEGWEVIRYMIANSNVILVTFNASTLFIPFLVKYGVDVAPQNVHDTRLMAWMIQPSKISSDYDSLCSEYQISIPDCDDVSSLQGTLERTQTVMALHTALLDKLQLHELDKSFFRIESHVAFICCSMKAYGMQLDVESLSAHSSDIRQEMTALKEKANQLAGKSFNIQSPDDVRHVLFDVLQLPTVGGNTRTGKQSTSEETLKALAAHHELPKVIIQYRKNAKLVQTYVEGLVGVSHPTNDRCLHDVHANFLQESTDTGRLSCTEPNLQNLPRPSEVMGVVRKAFTARDGYTFVTIDYEQIELRVLTHFCQDGALLKMLNSKGDIHSAIAAHLFGKSDRPWDVTSEERQVGKRIVYGILYGMGPAALGKQVNCEVDDASKFITKFKDEFQAVAPYMNNVIATCRNMGHVRTLMYRWRPIPDIHSRDGSVRSYAERQAVNTVIQGSAADIVKCAMLAVADVIRKQYSSHEVRLVCQIHDELVFEVLKRCDVKKIAEELSAAMVGVVKLSVPLVVKTQVGPSLGELKIIEE